MILSTAQAKQALKSTSDDATFTAELERWIAAVSESIASICGGKVELNITEDDPDETVIEFAGFGNNTKFLPFANVASIVKIEERESHFDEWTELDAADYRLIKQEGCFYAAVQGYFRKWTNYRITLTAGWAVVPAPIVQVAAEMLSIMWEESRHGKNTVGQQSSAETFNGIALTKSYRDMLPKWRETLAPYRVPTA